MKKAIKQSRRVTQTALVSAALAFSATGPVSAATINDNLVNTVQVIDSCYVLATGVDFGVVTTPMLADIPGTLPNVSDTGTIAVNVPGVGSVDVLTVSTPGVNVVCSQTPTDIVVTLGGGGSIDLMDAPTGPTAAVDGVMTKSGGTATLDYEMGFLAVSTPTLLNGVVAVYAGVFAVNPLTTKIPQQELAGGSGTYVDTATVVVTY